MPSDIEPAFRLSGAPANCLTPDAKTLFDERMSVVHPVLAELGWMVAKQAHALFLFSAVKANSRSVVSAASLRLALSEKGLIAESPSITTVSFGPGKKVQLRQENQNGGPKPVSDMYDLGDWEKGE